jgi:arylsulfatase A-like enzyme
MSPLRSIAAISIAAGLSLAPDVAGGFGEAHRSDDESQTPRRRPDVILVLTDQQRADAFGAAGGADLRTPVMDRLAREGVMFTRAFTATPQCSPSRAALLTGRYPHRTGVMGNTVGGEGSAGGKGPPPSGMSGPLDRSLPTLGRIFAAAGYETAYFGKWHLGGSPGDYGFQTHDSNIHDPTLASRVVAYLRKHAASETRPLLLIVSWLNPHDIYNVLDAPPPGAQAHADARLPSNLAGDLRDKPFPQRHYLEEDQGKPFVNADRTMWRRYRAFYNELVETVDREIGTVLGAVAPGDVPPITVFSTDHGDLGGAHGLPYKGPAMYEELVRIPLVISWPGRIRAASSDALVSLIDLLPTLCDLSGVPPPADVDGLSLRPVLTPSPASAPAVRELVFAEYYGKQSWRVPIRMVRSARWKYVRYLGYGEELYDLDADPGERRNLAGEAGAAAERARLARELDEWIRRTGDPFPELTTTDRSGSVVTAARGR